MEQKKQAGNSQLIKALEPYLYLLPVLLLFGIFTFYPLIRTIVMSLSAVNSMGIVVKFTGLSNFANLFSTGQFWKDLVTTVKLSVILVPLEIITGVLLALLADRRDRKKGNPIRVIFALPMSVSYACGSLIWLFIFNPTTGLMNHLLGRHVDWIGDANNALLMIVITTCWLTAGMNFVYAISGLQSVPDELYECSRLEGAGYLQTLCHITLPMISPTLFYLLIINTINAFQTFTQIRLMTQGGPGGSTHVLAYSIYDSAFISNRWGNACAQSVIFFLILLVISVLQFRFERKGVFYQ
ncbi:MAG TPA: sugar ABC transporter permease [Candidatus Pullilachnospira intestinigallinarum]|nr:sugar ABC transporter permease [Clostridiales bacterium]HIS25614.1 sugar ABC transporter permease [Candidatus Pullilachnospira intestinigallinarum]